MSELLGKILPKAYSAPRLTVYGDVVKLTAAGGSVLGEKNGSSNNCGTNPNQKC